MSSNRQAFSPVSAANAAGVGRTTIFMEMKSGRLRAKKIGRRTIILSEDLKAWLDALPDQKMGKRAK